MTHKHTPAPWIRGNKINGYNAIENKGKFDPVAWVDFDNNSDFNLALAAPELLEALEGMMKIKNTWVKGMDGCEESKYPEMARKAIAKAKGERK